jgi:glucosylceramidase
MLKFSTSLYLLGSILLFSCAPNLPKIEKLLTTHDGKKLLEYSLLSKAQSTPSSAIDTLWIRPSIAYQVMDGFGFTLTGGSAQHLMHMNASARKTLLIDLFGFGAEGIGISYLRISLGASDLDATPWTYLDLPEGAEDLGLTGFTLAFDTVYMVPLLKEILSINPDIGLMASPWSAPSWMKTLFDSRGGSLGKKYYSVYAHYLVKYLEYMQAEGIFIKALTIQNEPLHPGNNPSMFMPAEEQALFIRDNLGPLLAKERMTTQLIIYDHNADRIDYPLSILADSVASQYITGAAFHLYGGTIDELSKVHHAFPDKGLYFTEQWMGAPGNFKEDFTWHVSNLMIGAPTHYAKIVLEWNLVNGVDLKPHTDRGGCTSCLGALTIEGDQHLKNTAYYVVGHLSKWVRPGAHRIKSELTGSLQQVAFQNTDGKVVLLIQNEQMVDQTVAVEVFNKWVPIEVPAASTLTIKFQ